jgi:hypothetical protein
MVAKTSRMILPTLSAAVTFFAVLAGSAQGAVTTGTVTGGSALGQGGTFIELTTPLSNPFGPADSVGKDTYQDPNLYAFNEVDNFVLTTPLTLDIGTTTLAPGIVVTSHFVFFDPGPLSTIVGTVSFDEDILGVISSHDNLVNSNYLGAPGVNYLDPRLVGLEQGNSVTISGTREITIDTRAITPGDYIRVITTSRIRSIVPEPATWLLMLGAFAGLGWTRRRQFASA